MDATFPITATAREAQRRISPDAVRHRKRAALLSLSIGGVMFVLKVVAYRLTGSTAVLSDALESVVHVAATSFVLYSVIQSAKPPDLLHPYGHGKVEFFSAGFEGALIIIAAVVIVEEVTRGLLRGQAPERLDAGILITLAVGAVNLVLGFYLIRVGKRTGSLTLVADGKHVLTDSYTTLGVVVGLALVLWTAWPYFDALVAVAIALNILLTGSKLVKESVRGLMDEADVETLGKILDVIKKHRKPEWIDIHHLRSWRAGERLIVDMHLTIPFYWDIQHGHVTQEALENMILDELDTDGEVIVHLDPCTFIWCSLCDLQPCPVRLQGPYVAREWTVETVTGDPPFGVPGT